MVSAPSVNSIVLKGGRMRKSADTVILQSNPGFFAAMGSHLGNALGILFSVIIAVVAVFFTLSWMWPTLKWLVPVFIFLLWHVWLLHHNLTQSDELARSHYGFKTNVLAVSNLIIFSIIATTAKVVG